MSKRKRPSQVRVTRFDFRASSAAEDSKDLSTNDAIRRRAVLRCQISALEAEQIELATRQAQLKQQRADLEAQVIGVTMTIQKRR